MVEAGSITAENEITTFRQLFTWAEASSHPLNLGTVHNTYLAWADYLIHRQRSQKDIAERSTYQKGAVVGAILDKVLERQAPIIQLTRLRMPSTRKTARGVQAEKQNLQETFEFGFLLQDICDALPVRTVLNGELPLRIVLRNQRQLVLQSGARRTWSARALADYQAEGSLQTRSPLANLRIEAELLMFIGQTGMNVSQAEHLPMRSFFYASHLDGYQVRDRKNRRGGEVLFEVFKEYKPHFERYLDWRRQIFPESVELFPFVIGLGGRSREESHQFRLRVISKDVGIQFVPPRSLRNTRINWLLRNSGDVAMTSEMSQHTKEVLLAVYERPSQQRAISELMRFWNSNDPTTRMKSVGPGDCDGRPAPQRFIPMEATKPDCLRPSGCLWCEHHRDIDSEDYIWSLASFRHLKTIELSRWNAPQGISEKPPAEHAVNRLSEKLLWFTKSNSVRRSWVEEALTRMEEGVYHPTWRSLIVQLEAGQ